MLSLTFGLTFYCWSDVGTHFKRLIPEEGLASQNPAGVKRIVFCTGKVYYDLIKQRKNKDMEATVAIARIEQVLAQMHFLL